MVILEGMTIVPHSYQLKGAAQAHFSCRGINKGFMLGDAMGVGKTLAAILALYLARDEPGASLVVCPKSLCIQWMETIHAVFAEVRRAPSVSGEIDGPHSLFFS